MDYLRALRQKGKQPALTCADDFFYVMVSCFIVGLLVHTLYIHILILGFTWYALAYTVVILVGSYLMYREYMKMWHARI